MDARMVRAAWAAAVLWVSLGASYRTANFVVTAPTPEVAKAVGEAAERYRRELAQEWLGRTLPNWSRPCPIEVRVGPELGAGGATSFVFDRGEVFGWQMSIQGSLERVLDSVLPHEITHTIFASHFRQPLPRWADEGACSTVEHPSERLKQQRLLITFLKTGRGISFQRMFAMTEYPPDVLPLYAQGHSLATFLIQQGGRRKFLAYLAEGMRDGRWSAATERQYGYRDLTALQDAWLEWVRAGSPPLSGPRNAVAASGESGTPATRVAAAGEGRLVPVRRSGGSVQANDSLARMREQETAETGARRAGEWRPAGLAARRAAPPVTADAAAHAADMEDLANSVRSAVNRPPAVQKLRQMIVQWDSRGPSASSLPSREEAVGNPEDPAPEADKQQAELAADDAPHFGWHRASTSRPRRGAADEADWGPSVYDVRARAR